MYGLKTKARDRGRSERVEPPTPEKWIDEGSGRWSIASPKGPASVQQRLSEPTPCYENGNPRLDPANRLALLFPVFLVKILALTIIIPT